LATWIPAHANKPKGGCVIAQKKQVPTKKRVAVSLLLKKACQ